MRPLNGFSEAKLLLKPCRPSWPPKSFNSVTEPIVCRMISAAATGINVDRVVSVVWIVGAMLAGLSGVLLGMTQGFDYQLGFKILLLVFAATVLGGLGTAWGAIVGALVIGLFVEVSTLFIPAELKFVGALVVLIVVLLIRPQGLLGKAQRVG